MIISLVMENHMEKHIDNEMETGKIWWVIRTRVS